jgi:hypothetical protein
VPPQSGMVNKMPPAIGRQESLLIECRPAGVKGVTVVMVLWVPETVLHRGKLRGSPRRFWQGTAASPRIKGDLPGKTR